MGFGWFGLSTFWLLALCWPGVRGLLGGEIRIFGPGTLRMLLGVPLATVSSATLAALTGGDGNTAGGSVGQSLSHGLHVALGDTLAMGVAGLVLLFSIPLVFGTTWWGMFARRRPDDDGIDAPSYEARLDGVTREPLRGLSRVSLDMSERGERSERYHPTLGQGHHNVGSLAQEPVPRRRGLAAQPRWKLSDEERARLDAMQPPPLTTRGAPRAEPTFARTPAGRVAGAAGKGASGARPGVAAVAGAVASAGASAPAGARVAPLPGSYASDNSVGDALRMTAFVRREPGLPARDARTASSAAAPQGVARTSGAAKVSSVSNAATSLNPAVPKASVDPLHSTSIPGVSGYRRPVGMAPAHLRGTIVHSPFRKPQLGLEDVPPRGAAPTAPRAHEATPPPVSPEAIAAHDAAPISEAHTATTRLAEPPAAPVIRGAARWSATDAATPLASEFAAFSPVDLSTGDAGIGPNVLPPAPTPEMLAQQEAAREAERVAEREAEMAALAHAKAMAALRDEAQALLRDLRDWTSTDVRSHEDAASRPLDVPGAASATAGMPGVGAPEVPAGRIATSTGIRENARAQIASHAALDAPSTPTPVTLPRPFVFADVLASVEPADARQRAAVPTAGPSFVASEVRDMPQELAASTPGEVSGALTDTLSDVIPADTAEAIPVTKPHEAGEGAASKPHYVLRADGTWARADETSASLLPATSASTAPAVQVSPFVVTSDAAPPIAASPSVPPIPSFATSTAFAAATAAEPSRANFSSDTPYALPPPRVPIDYDLPPLELLAPATSQDLASVVSDEALAAVSQLIEQRLAEFKVPVTVVGASAGPVITRFEVEPAVGVRGAQVVGLMKDLARALGVTSIRVVETIPGKTCMGLELPNAQRQMIRLSEILTAAAFDAHRSRLALAMGKDITGEPVVADLARAPHLLVAGTTGSGKSVAVNAMILSLLYKATPEDVRLIMIDPKMLELSVYGGIPHLLAPVVTDMKQAAHALNWCVGEMEKRYRLMSALGVRNLAGYNEKIDAARSAGEKVSNPFSLTPDAPEPLDRLPFIVVVIDELADLMMVAGKKIEELIARLAQKARAAGIHLILATQRPSVDVITGLIKANIPTRVAFQVSSKIDSRTILDQMGAESLLGQGDMLFLPPGTGYPQRVHGAFVADDEVHRVVQHWQQYGEPDYDEAILAGDPGDAASADLFGETPGDAEADPLYDEAAAFVLNSRRASISAVQRQLRIGYNRAARLIEQMETAGIVSPMGRNGAREVIVASD